MWGKPRLAPPLPPKPWGPRPSETSSTTDHPNSFLVTGRSVTDAIITNIQTLLLPIGLRAVVVEVEVDV